MLRHVNAERKQKSTHSFENLPSSLSTMCEISLSPLSLICRLKHIKPIVTGEVINVPESELIYRGKRFNLKFIILYLGEAGE